MAQRAPGKHFREGMSIVQLVRMFPDEAAAEQWFVDERWPDGVHCPACGSLNVQERRTRKPQPYRCRDCRKDFSVKTGTLMQGLQPGPPDLADRALPALDQPQGSVVDEDAPGPRGHAEDRVAPGPPHPGVVVRTIPRSPSRGRSR